MKQQTISFQYMLLTYRLDMLWLPAAFWGLFVILAWMLRDDPAGFHVTMAYFGAALPLIGGMLAAYALLEDPALELQFAAPYPAWRMLFERLGMILFFSTVCALGYQAAITLLGVDLALLGSFPARQLAWLAPTLAMVGLSSAISFASRQAVTGAAITGIIWMMQILLRGWFLQDRWGQYLLLFMGSNYPDHPALRGNQAALMGLAVLLLCSAWALLRRQERYI